MFRQTCTAVFVLAALGSFTLATAQETKQASSAKQITNSIGMKLTLIPSGEFMMGSGESAEEMAKFFRITYGMDFVTRFLFDNEHPQHRVRITKPFNLGTYHVTWRQFSQFVKETGYKTDAETGDEPGADGWDPKRRDRGFYKDYFWRNTGFVQTDDHPVLCVSWNDAIAFCKWLSRKEGKTYRLPTEAEWEYACRAGTSTRYCSGDDPETLVNVANVADAKFKVKFPSEIYTIKASDGYAFTAPVGQFKPNAFGLYDMCGNAQQWCADWSDNSYYEKSPADDPKGPDGGTYRIIRGGTWSYSPILSSRSASRCRDIPNHRDNGLGFRVVQPL